MTGVDSHALTLQVRVPANIDKSKNVSIVIQKKPPALCDQKGTCYVRLNCHKSRLALYIVRRSPANHGLDLDGYFKIRPQKKDSD